MGVSYIFKINMKIMFNLKILYFNIKSRKTLKYVYKLNILNHFIKKLINTLKLSIIRLTINNSRKKNSVIISRKYYNCCSFFVVAVVVLFLLFLPLILLIFYAFGGL